jgi:hypothetical protein
MDRPPHASGRAPNEEKIMKTAIRLNTLLLAGAASLLAAGGAAADCNYKATRSGEESAAGVKRVVIVAEAGDLEVFGKSGAGKIVARGEACASSSSQLERIQLETRQSGDTVTITAKVDREKDWGWTDNAWMDLEIEVPSAVEVEIEDGSGDSRLRDLGQVRMEDGSGDVRIDKVASLRLVDGSGDIEIDGSGELEIEDGSGDILVRNASADVMIDEDGSGDIEISKVGGSVTVRDDGSGSIYVTDVRGDFTVDSDGSGEIEHKNVTGKVSIPAED